MKKKILELLKKLRTPSAASLGSLLMAGFVAGIIFWGGFNTAMEATNTETFCISCHEMEANVYQEYKYTIHYSNRSGVRATCPDCHVPKPWTTFSGAERHNRRLAKVAAVEKRNT